MRTGDKEPALSQRMRPFLIAAAVLAVVCLAVLRLPDSFLSDLRTDRPLSGSQAGWAYRLLALAAAGQAFYGGFFILRTERVARSREDDPKIRALSRERLFASIARNAAGTTALTILYGLAALGLTAERGGFWLFPTIALVQGAWYFRQVGEVGRWLAFQEETEELPAGAWEREPPDYCPPLARGLTPVAK